MAGDWIKMRMDLQTHPKVVRIMSALRADKFRTIGGLHAVWCVFDAHSEDGVLEGYTAEAMDDSIGWPGFAAAMQSVDWLDETPQGLTMPRFDNHNGKSAKRRASDTERKRSVRTFRNLSANDAEKSGTREEKRREDISLPIGRDTAPAKTSHQETQPDPLSEGVPESITAHQVVIQEFNAVAPVRCTHLTDKRRKAMAQRLRDRTWNWRAALDRIPDSDFLSGRAGNWKGCTIDFFLRPDTVTRILEGAFDNGSPQRKPPPISQQQFAGYTPNSQPEVPKDQQDEVPF